MRRRIFDEKIDLYILDADYVGLDSTQVREFVWVQLMGKPVRKEAVCKQCGTIFPMSRSDKKFCTRFCKDKWWTRERRRIIKEDRKDGR